VRGLAGGITNGTGARERGGRGRGSEVVGEMEFRALKLLMAARERAWAALIDCAAASSCM
jgi:hypothetical protein